MNALRELHRANPVLAISGWIQWALFAAFLALYAFDTRRILGISPWIKPMKFAVSLAIYVWTLAWYLRYLDSGRSQRAVRIISWTVAAIAVAEIFCIALQSARGTTSHYNIGTPFDAAVFNAMGLMILVNTLAVVWTLVLFSREQPAIPRPYVWGIRFGLLVFLLAGMEGGLMIGHQAHTVGAPDGGPGLPLVNWSTQHGDLRPAHFVGMHGLQIFAADRLSRRAKALDRIRSIACRVHPGVFVSGGDSGPGVDGLAESALDCYLVSPRNELGLYKIRQILQNCF